MNVLGRKKLIICSTVFVCVIISIILIILYLYNCKTKNYVNYEKNTNLTVSELGIKNGDEFAIFIKKNIDSLKLPMKIDKLVDIDRIAKNGFHNDINVKKKMDDIKGVAYNNLIKILSTNDYDSSLYPITEKYINKYKNKSFVSQSPASINKKVNGGLENLNTGIIYFEYYNSRYGELNENGDFDQTTYQSKYKMSLDNNGYIDDIEYLGTYQTIDSNGEESYDGNREVKYMSFQIDQAEKCILLLCRNKEATKCINDGFNSIYDKNSIQYKIYDEMKYENYLLNFEFLINENFKKRFAANKKFSILPDENFENIYIASENGKDVIDLNRQYCQVCAEYDNKYVYYDIYWDVDEDYFLDKIDVKENKVVNKK